MFRLNESVGRVVRQSEEERLNLLKMVESCEDDILLVALLKLCADKLYAIEYRKNYDEEMKKDSSIMNCPRCNRPVNAEGNYCDVCGYPLPNKAVLTNSEATSNKI